MESSRVREREQGRAGRVLILCNGDVSVPSRLHNPFRIGVCVYVCVRTAGLYMCASETTNDDLLKCDAFIKEHSLHLDVPRHRHAARFFFEKRSRKNNDKGHSSDICVCV